MIYAPTRQEQDRIFLEVLQRLRQNCLCLSPDKCEWAQHQVEFLGYLVSGKGIERTNDKIKTIQEIRPVSSLKEVQSFLGFANFYRRFIKKYSKICLPLTNSTQFEARNWKSSPQIHLAQEALKRMFTSVPILKHFHPEIPAIVETDASDFALGGTLSRRHDDRLHPVAFHSRKFASAEIFYDIHDKKLLATVYFFKKWRRYLEGVLHQVQIIPDHNNLELFATTKVLNRRQAHGAQELAGYDFKIYFRPGKKNGKADYLSRRPEKHFAREKSDAVDGEKDGKDAADGKVDGKDAVDGKKDGSEAEDGKKDGSDAEDGKVTDAEDGKVDGKDVENDKENGLKEISTAGEGLRFIISSARLCPIPAVNWNNDFLQ